MNKYLIQKIKIVSFLSILMVVFLHGYNLEIKLNDGLIINSEKSYNWFFQNLISQGFTRIAVPLFFLISGYLFFININGTRNDFVVKIKKRIKTLLIPFLFWSLFGILFYFILQSLPQLQSFFNKELVKDYTLATWITTVFVLPLPYQLWFIRDLFILVLLSPLLYLGVKRLKYYLLVIFFTLWFSNLGELNNSIEALLFFYSGALISILNLDISTLKLVNKNRYVVVTWIILVGLKVGTQFYDFPNYLVNFILKFSILVGIISFWGIYDYLYANYNSLLNRMSSISSYTFFIYVSHEPVLTIYKKGLFVILGKEEVGYFQVFVLSSIMTIITCIILGFILKKYMYLFYSIITGGR